MQNTKFNKLLDLVGKTIKPVFSESWGKRSILLLSLLTGFYFTNSFLSYLLDKSINTVFLAIIILALMEISIRTSLFPKSSIIPITINNFRIGSSYALILEAFKLGS